MKNRKKIYYWFDILIMLLVNFFVLLDLLSKNLTDGKDITIIDKFLYFTSTHNTGAAYGIFSGKTIYLAIFSAIILILIFIYNYFNKNKNVFYCISISLIIGGAIGNLFDRLFFGYVRDFIQFSFFSFNCNFADICLTFGVILFVIYLLFFDKFREKKNDKSR